jgi:hypothetical protein
MTVLISQWILLSRFGWQYWYHSEYYCLGLDDYRYHSEYYCLGLDDSTDITDVCQLVIFVLTIDKNFEIKEQFLILHHLTTGTKGSYICYATNTSVYEFTSFEKCNVIVTDGAKSMVESKTVLVGHLKHCIIHQ